MDDFSGERRPKSGRSLFGPLFLIGLGVYFLLWNLGIVSELNWGAAFQLWPLLLIFFGINIIVQQVRRPFGTFLSGIVSLFAVLLFGALLLFGTELPGISRLNLQSSQTYRQERVAASGAGVETAVVTLDLGSLGAELQGLNSSQNVLEGTLNVAGDLNFRESKEGSESTISLSEDSRGLWWGGWLTGGQQPPWQIGLSRTVSLDLTVDAGSGPVELALGSLLLSNLEMDLGSGPVDVQLPAGDYEIRLDGGSGPVKVILPQHGRQVLDVDAGSGPMELYLPATMQARVEFDSGSGPLSLDERFEPVSGDDEDGIWQTPGYNPNGENAILITVDGASGPIAVSQSSGR